MELVRAEGAPALWLEPRGAARVVLFLDGGLYRERVGAPGIVDALRADGAMQGVRCAFLDAGSDADRHADFACSDTFTARLVEQLPPRLGSPPVLVGLSLSGLAAAYAAVTRPDVFAEVVCQSPSAWWCEGWLARQTAERDLSGSRCWLSVGDEELPRNVAHRPSGMWQGESQVASCARLAESLRGAGVEVAERLFMGGHDPACWARDLPDALGWVLRG